MVLTQFRISMRLMGHLLQILVQNISQQFQRCRLDGVPSDRLTHLGHDYFQHLLCVRRTHFDAGRLMLFVFSFFLFLFMVQNARDDYQFQPNTFQYNFLVCMSTDCYCCSIDSSGTGEDIYIVFVLFKH